MLSLSKSKWQKSQAEVIGYKLHKLASAADRKVDQRIQDKYGVSQSQFLILFGAAGEWQPTQCAVARFLNLTQAAVSRQIDNLVERGLITRLENSENRREHLLTITASGQDVLTKVKTEVQAEYTDMLSDVSASELKVFEEVLSKLLGKVCEATPETEIIKEGEKYNGR